MADTSWRRALSEDEIPAAFRNVYGDRSETPLSVQMADIGVEFTPVGTVSGVLDIKEELESEDPDYTDVALMVSTELLGLTPVGEAGSKLIGGVKSRFKDRNLQRAADLLREELGGKNPRNEFRDLNEARRNKSAIPYDVNERIWNETGWYVDPLDGQWRYEIDDSQAEMFPKGFVNTQTKNNTRPVITYEEFKTDPYAKVTFKLGDILSHDELYKNYPKFKDADVELYSEADNNILGWFSQDLDRIGLNAARLNSNEELKSTLLHEIQHMIQKKEGFSRGSNKSSDEVLARLETEKNDKFVIYGNLKNKQLQLKAKLRSRINAPTPQVRNNLIDEIQDLEREIQSIENFLKDDNTLQYALYRGAGGEIEARLVQRRMNLTPEERVADQRTSDNYDFFVEGDSVGGFPLADRNIMIADDNNLPDYAEGALDVARKIDDRREPGPLSFFGKLKRKYDDLFNKSPEESKFGLTSSASSEGRNFTPESKPYRENPSIKPEVEKAFKEVANTQRGNPELAMVEAQRIYGGGVMPNALEHIGDLTHRMAERGGRYGAEFVAPKVTRMLDSLLSDYGFEKEMLENIQSNARFKYKRDNPDIPFEQYKKEYETKIDKALKKYSEEHKKVPVYNQMQLAGREAAIAIGEKRYTDAIEQLYIIDQAIKDGRYKQLALEFDPDIDFRKKNKFAEGGAVGNMNQQMSFAFEDGGLRDDGMLRDPVSGNEVPSGSMANEVRDDIPAQLSEGEYVVPADVVRYYGVKFFEDLRNEAKYGLQEMEANGRIGGEPVPAGGPINDDDLDDEELEAIQELMGMAEGGVVDAYLQQQTLYQDPAPMAVGNTMSYDTGYNVGGLAQQTEEDIYTAGQQASQNAYIGSPLGFSLFSPSESKAFEPVNLIHPETFAKVVATTQQMYEDYIEQGYIVDDGSLQPPVAGAAMPPVGGGDGGGGTPPPPGESKPAYEDWLNSADFNSETGIQEFVNSIEYDPSKSNLDMQTLGATALFGPMAGLATAAGGALRGGGLQAISDLRAASLIAKAQGLDELAGNIDAQVADIIKDGPDILDFLDDVFASGKQKANAWAKKNGHENIEAATEAGVTPKPATTPTAPITPTPTNSGDDSPTFTPGDGTRLRDTATNAGDRAAAVQEQATSTGQSIAEVGREMAPSTAETQTDVEEATGGQGDQGKGSGWGGMNKGGLMAKGKKRKKKK